METLPLLLLTSNPKDIIMTPMTPSRPRPADAHEGFIYNHAHDFVAKNRRKFRHGSLGNSHSPKKV